MTSAAETLYPNSPTGPVIADYHSAAPAPAATPASSSAAAPAPDPAVQPAETPPNEKPSASEVLYGSGPAELGNKEAATAIARENPPATDVSAKPGETKPEATAEQKAEPEVTEELPAALKATRWQGPTPASTTDYEASLAPDGSKFEKGEQYESVKAALHAGGVPITAAIAVMDIVKDFAKSGPTSHTAESATAVLEKWAPGQSAQLIENARKMIDKMQKGWPQLRAELVKTNLDNSPRLVYALHQIYTTRSRR